MKDNTTSDVISVVDTVPVEDASFDDNQDSSKVHPFSPDDSTKRAQEVDGSKVAAQVKSIGRSIDASMTCSGSSRSKASVYGQASSESMSSPMDLSPALLSLKAQLTQVEHSWAELFTDFPSVQQRLHQVRIY